MWSLRVKDGPISAKHRWRVAVKPILVVWLALLAGCSSIQLPTTAAIASANPLATQAGLRILDQGGNAFDAAVATAAVLAVVEPYSSGIGGGGFWLLYDAKQQRYVVIDAREMAPQAASRDMYLDAQGNPRNDHPSTDGPLAAGIPGEPAALAHITEHYGRMPLSANLRDAIRLAQQGFRVGDIYSRLATYRAPTLRKFPASASIFLDKGNPPQPGAMVQQPALARTLYYLGLKGHQGFYDGPVARSLVEDVRSAGGIWTLEDLQGYKIIEREPIGAQFPDGSEVITVPPPSSGGVALVEMLNTLNHFDWRHMDSLERTHLLTETMKLAYKDRAEYLGDSDFVSVPVARLTSPEYADSLAQQISLTRALPPVQGPATTESLHTTHFSVIDRQGNMVSTTLSINLPFGSAFTSPRTGVLLNDEMDDFVIKPGVPNSYGLVGNEQNAIAPGKRPLSSMTPSIVKTPGKTGILGTPGGSRIISMVYLAVLDMIEGHPVESWVARPRFHHQYIPDEIQFEPGALTPEQQKQLTAMGHHLHQIGRRYGNMQAILWDETSGKVTAASDPRGEGQAISR